MNSKLKVTLIIILIVIGIGGCYLHFRHKEADFKRKEVVEAKQQDTEKKQIHETIQMFIKPYQPVELIDIKELKGTSLDNQRRYNGKNIYLDEVMVKDILQVGTNIIIKGHRKWSCGLYLTANPSQIDKVKIKSEYDKFDIVVRVSNIRKGTSVDQKKDEDGEWSYRIIDGYGWDIHGALLDITTTRDAK